MLSVKNVFSLLFLSLLSVDVFGAVFERLAQSKTHSNIYFQFKATGNFRTSIDVYEITSDGWIIKDVLVFKGLEKRSDFQLNKVSVTEDFLYAATTSQIIRFDLDVNGLPIQSSIRSIWQSEADSYQPLFFSDDGSVFYTYDREFEELYLYVAKDDTYELVDQKSEVFLSTNEVSIHPDGSLIKDNSVYPLQGNKIGDYIHTSDLTEYVVHQDADVGRNIFFDDNGDVIFKTNTFSNGGYVAKLTWPVAERDFNYVKLVETKNYSRDVNLGEVKDFMLSADNKWLIFTEPSTSYSAEFHLFQLDENYNVLSHWYFDEAWFSTNVENNHKWEDSVGFTPPIELGNSLWIGNLQLDINNPTQLLSAQDISFLQIDNVTRYSKYHAYDNDLVIIPEGDNGAIRLELDEQGNIISRESQLLPIDYSLVTGTSPQSHDDYSYIERDVFSEGNINNFSIYFGSEYSNAYDSFFDDNGFFDIIGFVNKDTLVVHSREFPHRVKVRRFTHTIGFVQNTIPELTLNQNDVLSLDIAEYVTLSENVHITLSEYSDFPANEEYEVIYESTNQNIEFTVSKALALRQNNQQPLYLEVHDNEWRFRAQLPLTIENINESPVAIYVETQTMDKGDLYGGHLVDIFTDPDFDLLAYHVTGLPNGLILSDDYISGAPTKEGTYTVIVTATDPTGLSVDNQFDIVVRGDDSSSGGSFNWFFVLLFCLVGIIRSQKAV